MSTYTAKDIKVLEEEDAGARFIFKRVELLCNKYPHIPEDCVSRMIEAAHLAQVSEEAVEARYLQGDKTVDVGSEYREIYKNLAARATRGFGYR